jgi:hypothetical protein
MKILLVPQGWAIRGILRLLDGMVATPLLLNSLVMPDWSATFFIIDVWRFNKRYHQLEDSCRRFFSIAW